MFLVLLADVVASFGNKICQKVEHYWQTSLCNYWSMWLYQQPQVWNITGTKQDGMTIVAYKLLHNIKQSDKSVEKNNSAILNQSQLALPGPKWPQE